MTTLELKTQIKNDIDNEQNSAILKKLQKYYRKLKLAEKSVSEPVPVADEALMTKEDFFAKIDRSLLQAKEGKVTKIKSQEELMSFLDSL